MESAARLLLPPATTLFGLAPFLSSFLPTDLYSYTSAEFVFLEDGSLAEAATFCLMLAV